MKKIMLQTLEKGSHAGPIDVEPYFGNFLFLYKIVMKPTWGKDASRTPGIATLPRVSLGEDRG